MSQWPPLTLSRLQQPQSAKRTTRKLPAPAVAAERDILKAILDYLAARHILAWRQNVGAIPATYKGRQRFIRYGQPGTPDILGVIKVNDSGVLLAIEVKTKKGRVSPEQKAFGERLVEAGACYFVARSVEDVQDGIGTYLSNLSRSHSSRQTV